MTNSETMLRQKVQEYHRLKTLKKAVEDRLSKLGDDLKRALPPGESQIGTFKVNIQVRDRTTLDEDAALALIAAKNDDGLWNDCVEKIEKVHSGAVEQAYLEGRLTDADLRAIRKPQYSLALTTEVVDDVQSIG